MKKKKFQTEIFQNFILQPPKFLFHNGFKHQKWKLHEDLTPIPQDATTSRQSWCGLIQVPKQHKYLLRS